MSQAAGDYADSITRINDCYNLETSVYLEHVGWSGNCRGNYEDSTIETSYNTGTIYTEYTLPEDPDEPLLVGGILGSNEGTVSSCYYLEGSAQLGVGDKEPGDIDNIEYTKKLRNDQMKVQDSFTGFDFESIWQIIEGEYPYPIFR